ncbi:MAG: FAD-dependent oxidoreductase [Caldilineaceae bacterium]
MTLEWVGHIPGKTRAGASRAYMLTQQDIVEQRHFDDAVSFGGWSIDLHPADGVYSPRPGCDQWHAKGIYQIPYRCLYSKNIRNLFLAGRIVSVSHVAFGSTRVMATCANSAQAVGMAAVLCRRWADARRHHDAGTHGRTPTGVDASGPTHPRLCPQRSR